MNSTVDLSPKAIKQARNAAVDIANRAKIIYATRRVKDLPEDKRWGFLEQSLGITIPDDFKRMVCNYDILSNRFAPFWINSSEERLRQALAPKVVTPEVIVSKPKQRLSDIPTDTIGEVTLFPEQQVAVDVTWQRLMVDKITDAIYCPAGTGAGKTLYAAALISRFRDRGLFNGHMRFCYVLYVTHKNVVENAYREFERCGLGDILNSKLLVRSYSQLTSRLGGMFIQEKYDPIYDRTSFSWNTIMQPLYVFWDEGDALNLESKRTKAALTLIKAPGPPQTKCIFLSATPFFVVNHSKTFVLATRKSFLGMRITEDNFQVFAGQLSKDPSKPNKEASKKLRELLGDCIVTFPYIKWPHKSINQVLLLDFKDEKDKARYNLLYQQYLDKCEKLGKSTNFGQFEQMVARGQHLKGVEPMRMDEIVKRALEDHRQGFAPIIITNFVGALQKAAFLLADAGIPREKFTVIWGGRKELDPSLYYTQEESDDILNRWRQGEEVEPTTLKRMKATLEWRTSRIDEGLETMEDTFNRQQRLAELKLTGMQSQNRRQIEHDNFQDGTAEFCLFTLAAGCVGINLDQNKPHLRQRKTYMTLNYSGRAVLQALGRGMRRNTLSDIEQYICLMKDTFEEYHVAPNIDKKMHCIVQFNSMLEIVDLSPEAIARSEAKMVKLRSKEEAIAEAEDESSQIHETSDSDELVVTTDEEDDN